MTPAQALRLLSAGAFAIACTMVGLYPTVAPAQDRAVQQKGVPKAEAEKGKKRAVKPKPKPAPKAKPRPKPKPKPKPPAPPAGDAVKPKPEPPAKPKPVAKQMLTPAEAARRYEDGLRGEQAGDDHGALRAFLEAAEAGHGPAQVRLGQLYDRGSAAVERDYATSLGWYQKARDNGMQIPKPHTYPAGR